MGKACTKCLEVKPFSAFYARKDSRSGYASQCIDCQRERLAPYAKQRWDNNRAAIKQSFPKICPGCDTLKNVSEYAKNKASDDGLQSVCKVCLNTRKKAYREANKDKTRAYMALWREQNVEHEVKYREENREATNERNRSWIANNPEKYRAKWMRRLVRTTVEQRAITPEAIKLLFDTYTACLCCGATSRLEVDHIIPVSKGGTNHVDNLQILCRNCNARKSAKTIDYRPKVG